MSSFWLLKTEPDCYTYADLEREQTTPWDGIKNAAALKYLRSMAPGDQALIYHTGDERCAVGLAEVTSAPYPDPHADDPRLAVVDVRALRPLARAVPLNELKQLPELEGSPLLRQGRLSVVPLDEQQWRRILELAGG